MSRKFLCVLICAAFILCAGCGGAEGGTQSPAVQYDTTGPTAVATAGPTVPSDFEDNNQEAELMMEYYKSVTPGVTYLPDYDPVGYPGIKALYFDGADMGGKKTKLFAYIGFPAGASEDSPVPAVVLQHGGAGFAFPQWIQQWTSRGYAAIAIANTGYKPVNGNITEFYSPKCWTRRLTAEEKAADERILVPDNNTTDLNGGKPNRQWMYHAVAGTILAHNLLRSDPRVIPEQIGLTGISWGGVITSIAMGFDTDFAFYIPIYGCAYLGQSETWMKNYFTPKTCEVWDAATRLDRVSAPILWLNWAHDDAFDIRTNCQSYLATQEHAVFAMRKEMGHSHDLGWLPLESYRFADWVIGRGEKMSRVQQPDSGMGRELSLSLDLPSDAADVNAQLHYLTVPVSYGADSKIVQNFQSVDCSVDIAAGRLTVSVPEEAAVYYIELSTAWKGGRYSTSTVLVETGKSDR